MARLIDASLVDERLANDLKTGDEMVSISWVRSWIGMQETVEALVIPCRVGDLVWVIRSYHGVKHPQQGRVSDLYITRDLRLVITVKHIARGEWGKEVFATCEEAQAEIDRHRSTIK